MSDLLIVGAGAKAAAIAAKVDALNGLGLAELTVTIVEKTEPAASWLGLNGMTSGEEPLAVPPIKDVGFPYRSSRQFPDGRRPARRRAPAAELAAPRDRTRRVRAVGQLGRAADPPPRLRDLPRLGAGAGDRGRDDAARAGRRGARSTRRASAG